MADQIEDTPGIWRDVMAQRQRALEKHGSDSIEAILEADPRWLSILMEEVGEVAHELTYDATGDLRAELIDVMSVAAAWVAALDRADEREAVRPSPPPDK